MSDQKPKVTACLITWKRQYNIPKIIESLLKWDFISEIIIADNSKRENTINWARYTSAMRAENDIIYTQDDDCIIENIGEIYDKFCEDQETVCHGGTEEYQQVIKDNIYGDHQMAMFGWGAFFNRKWTNVLDEYIKVHGKDYCFYRETDRIFTLLLRKKHNFVLSKIIHLEGEKDEHALSQKDDHIAYKNLSIARALEVIK
jgi:glycosyltransferase involved in cell wall biosynthesis